MIYPCETWLLHMRCDSLMCDMTDAYVTWLIHMWHDPSICHMIHSCVTHDSFICGMTPSEVTLLNRDVTVSHRYGSKLNLGDVFWHKLLRMRHGSFIFNLTPSYLTWLLHIRHESLISDMTPSYLTRLLPMRHDSLTSDLFPSYVSWVLHI